MKPCSLLLALILPITPVDATPDRIVEYPVRATQLVRLVQEVTGEDRVRVPLLVALDAQGDVVAFDTHWSNGEPLALVARARNEKGHAAFGDMARRAGIDTLAPIHGPALVVLTLPGACPPCARLVPVLEDAADASTGVAFVAIRADPIPAGTK